MKNFKKAFDIKVAILFNRLIIGGISLLTKIKISPIPVAEAILAHISISSIKGKRGFYIECGANDGLEQSNTLRLEKLGWSGLLIEPSPKAYKSLLRNRSNQNIFANCALVSSDDIKTVSGDFDGSLMASVESQRTRGETKIDVQARTLQSILDENHISDIDFFSLDVEGFEYEVLKGIDLEKNPPTYILVELYDDNIADVIALLKKYKYSEPQCISNFKKITHPIWDGTHNDYLFYYVG